MMTQPAARTAPDAIADMNGPLAYWGPVTRPASTEAGPIPRPAPETQVAGRDLAPLARTLNGRTWTGTSTLMSLAVGMPAAA
jgi:hypothetical protein